jgi:hypothetical protein
MRTLLMTGSFLALAVIGCGEAPPTSPAQVGVSALEKVVDASSSQSELLDAVRRISARFHSEGQATKHGFVSTVDCVSSPAGGMGVHWLNESLVDPVFDPLHPENVLFAPGPNGIPKLVAVEYIVINVGQPAPTFGGQAFDVGGTPVPVPHWSLHVWFWKDNPSGLFAAFNPDVSCH